MSDARSQGHRWEGRLWTLFQLGLVALVGFLSVQAIDTSRLIAQLIVEQKYTNDRLGKIETKLERNTEESYQIRRAIDQMLELERRVRKLEEKP